jgi:hypothetical protein
MERDQHSGIGWLLYLYVCQPASAELNLFEYTHLQGGWLKISPLPDDRRQGLEKRIATFQIDLAMKLGVGEIHTDEITEDQGVIAASAPTDHAIPICIESQ